MNRHSLASLMVLVAIVLTLASTETVLGQTLSDTATSSSTLKAPVVLDAATAATITALDDHSVQFRGAPSAVLALQPGDLFVAHGKTRRVLMVENHGGKQIDVYTEPPELREWCPDAPRIPAATHRINQKYGVITRRDFMLVEPDTMVAMTTPHDPSDSTVPSEAGPFLGSVLQPGDTFIAQNLSRADLAIVGALTLASGVKLLDPATQASITASDDASVTFSGTPERISALQPGDILLSALGARRVVSVAVLDGNSVVRTETPNPRDVLEAFWIEGRSPGKRDTLLDAMTPAAVATAAAGARDRPRAISVINGRGDIFMARNDTGRPLTVVGLVTLATAIQVLDAETHRGIATSDDTSVTFSGAPTAISELVEGDIFIVPGESPREVLSVTAMNGNTFVETKRAASWRVFTTSWIGEATTSTGAHPCPTD